MGVLDDYLVDPNINMMDKTKIQAQVLVPVVQALRRELGREKADDLVRGALREWSKGLFAEIGKTIEGSGKRRWAALQGAFNDVTAQEVEFDIHRKDEAGLDIDVTRCRFAEFFRALGEPELGALLVCWGDVDIAEASGGEVRLERAQTLMQGASCCTFRYTFEPR